MEDARVVVAGRGTSPPRRRTAIALLALFALLIVVDAPAVDGPYLWDDHSLVERDEDDPVAMVLDPWHPASSTGLVGEVDPTFAIFGGVAIVLAVALAVWTWRHRATASRPAVVATMLGLAGLAPVLRVLPLGLASAVSSDRLLYVPLAGLVLVLAVLASALPSRAQLPAAAVAASLGLSFAFVSRARSDLYADELRFWLAASEQAHPHNTAPRSMLANIVRDPGVPEAACTLHASVVRVLSSTGRAGTLRRARAIENLASCDALIGRTDEAIALYRGLIASRPDAGRTYMGLGYVELQTMAFDDAEASFRRALALEPGLAIVRSALLDLPRTATSRDASPPRRPATPIRSGKHVS